MLGIYSSFHIAQLQVGMSTAHRIGQARCVEVRFKKKIKFFWVTMEEIHSVYDFQIHLKGKSPVQMDGEPWEQHPAVIKITAVDSATVLINTRKTIWNAP